MSKRKIISINRENEPTKKPKKLCTRPRNIFTKRNYNKSSRECQSSNRNLNNSSRKISWNSNTDARHFQTQIHELYCQRRPEIGVQFYQYIVQQDIYIQKKDTMGLLMLINKTKNEIFNCVHCISE